MPPETVDAVGPVDAEPSPHFRLDKLAVRKVMFEEQTREAVVEGEKRPLRVGSNMQFQASIQAGADATGKEHRAVVTLNVKVHQDRKWQPYQIEVVISGAFSGVMVTAEQFDEFCRISVPPILFPYVRQIIHSITSDANFGVVRIDPVNLSELAAKAEWIDQPIASTEPEPPSEQ